MAERLFDSYTLLARISSVFLVLLPLSIATGVWTFDSLSALHIGSVVVGPLALSMLFSQVGRDFGYRKQPHLWEQWDGPPATRHLRHRCTEFNPVLRDKYHRILKELLPEVEILGPEKESEDPEPSDQIYGACIKYLIAHTRNRKIYPLIYKENVSYGFRRKLWGMKAFGVASALVASLACGARVFLNRLELHHNAAELLIPLSIDIALLAVWLFIIKPDWVCIAANAYAERLLEACEHLKKTN
jgi:hypothetical protein